MSEIIQRGTGATLWGSKDAEGRQVYAVTTNRDGSAVEPSWNGQYTSEKEALKALRWTEQSLRS